MRHACPPISRPSPRAVAHGRSGALPACLAALLFAACADEDPAAQPDVGVLDDVADADDADPGVYDDDVEPGPTGLRRLTAAQYVNAIHDVFGPDIVIPPLAELDLEVGGLLSVGASSVSMSAAGVESLENSSFAIAEQAMAEEGPRDTLVRCEPAGAVDDACATETLTRLGALIWRRPLNEEELDASVAIAATAGDALGDFYQGLSFAIAGLLQSPNFMFRVELGDGATFDDYELASRLSFFLWNTIPDQELLDAAADGTLATEDGIRAQAERMLDDPRARQGMRNFFTEQLQLHHLEELTKDPTLFDQFSADLGPDAAEETLRLLEYIVFEQEGDYRDVMTTRDTFVNRRLAALYDIPAPVQDDFALVRIPRDRNRAGLLGHASWNNLHAHAVSSSATLRGKAVREILLCGEIPPPPVDVDVSIPEPSGETLTLRDRVAEHLENDSCAGCHSLMDPIGLGLENFDAIGAWRTHDNGAAIDVTGEIDGATFRTPVELAVAIRQHPDFAPCLVRTLTRYATGRVESRAERSHVEVLSHHFETEAYRVRPLLIEIAASPMFRSAGAPQ